jgi:uncharacterized protein
MKFEDTFTVPVTPAVAWDALTDIERVYPCLPGAELTEIRDNEFHGLVTVKLGPISASYKGTARFDSLDEENRTLVINAQGRDRHGQGTARAVIRAQLVPEGADSTRVSMTNEVDITGKAAQFGRGILPDVSRQVLAQFAANLRDLVTAPPSGAAGADVRAADAGPAPPPAAQPLSAGELAAKVAVNRARENPVHAALIALAVLALVRQVLRRRR